MRRHGLLWIFLLAAAVSCTSEGTDDDGAGAAGAGGGAPTDPSDPNDPNDPSDPVDPPPPYDPTGVVGYTLGLGLTDTVYEATGEQFAGMVGRGLGIDTLGPDGALVRDVFATFSHHDDIPSAPQTSGVMESTDRAATFGNYETGVDVPPQFAIQLRDGRILSYAFVPSSRVDSAAGSRLTLDVQASLDDGKTWDPLEAYADLSQISGGTGSVGRLSGHPIQLGDGTILLEWYGQYAGDAGGFRAELLASSDGGLTFERRGTIAVPPANTAYPEADVVELEDGSLYSVFRHHEGSPQNGQTLATLLYSRSTDEGFTWAEPKELLVSFGGRPAKPRVGINPQLVLMPNGVLVLSSGRPDNFVAVSTAGATNPGEVSFTEAKVTYVNYPSDTTAGYGSGVLRYHGSSGNTGVVVVEPNRLIQIGDNCANSWGCPDADSGYTIDGKNRVWRRFIEVDSPDVGKIDLASKYRRGEIAVQSDMTWGSELHRRARVEGAFDGSNDYWSSAVADSSEGTFTIELDRTYDLTRVGLSIRRDFSGDAKVYTSTDGESWEGAPIVTATGRAHRAIEYFILPELVRARYVRIVVGSEAPCDEELGSDCAFLNEVELYTTVDGFENDPVGNAPRGYRDISSAWITNYETNEMGRALRLVDSSDASMSLVRWTGVAGAEKTFEFSVLPVELPGGFLFDVEGEDAAGASVSAYHFAVFPDGSVAQYDLAAAMWSKLTDPGAVPIGATTRVRVEATTEEASISIDGEEIAVVVPSSPGAVALRGHVFSSSGTMPTGDQVLIDDVYFQ
ncbi:MAG: hypothetical protein HOW73_37145 [Polyangiaceae bacterium]|nr:hypothetical protein [Polyangiaceae bacterium]